jgi:hypothetical protein
MINQPVQHIFAALSHCFNTGTPVENMEGLRVGHVHPDGFKRLRWGLDTIGQCGGKLVVPNGKIRRNKQGNDGPATEGNRAKQTVIAFNV